MKAAAPATLAPTDRDKRTTAAGPVPPHNLEAEQSVLGGILLDNTSLYDIVDKLNEQDFYRLAHQRIFNAIVDLHQRQEPVDLITLTEHLGKRNQLDDIGGASYLANLANTTPTSANIIHYAKIVHQRSVLRRLIHNSTEIIQSCYSQDREVENILDDAERNVFEISAEQSKQDVSALPELIPGAIKKIEEINEAKNHITGVATGFIQFDRMTAGLQPSDLIVIAGRPSMGKTAFCLNIAQNAAAKSNVPVAIFSLEMAKVQLVMRMLSTQAGVDASKMKGSLDENSWPRLLDAADTLSKSPIFIDDTPNPSVLEMKAKARRIKAEHGLGLIMVDYLQLVKGRDRPESREREISEISRNLKAMAKELEVPVLALSQLNRGVESRQDKRPVLSDLRESGAIEQDADVIGFIYRDEFYNPDSPDKGIAEIIIGKQRNGPTGIVRLLFFNELTKFANPAQD